MRGSGPARRQTGEKRCPKSIYIQNNSLAWILLDMGHSYQNFLRCTFSMHIPQPCPRPDTLDSLEVDLGIYVFEQLPNDCDAH